MTENRKDGLIPSHYRQAHLRVSTPSLKWLGGYAARLMGMAGKFDTVDFEGDIMDKTPLVKIRKLMRPEARILG
jgi:hypothetical protein